VNKFSEFIKFFIYISFTETKISSTKE